MDSMTEVLAQAVYGLNLKDLPLNNLAAGQRVRTVSTGRHAAAARHEIAPLSSFSAIFEGPPTPAGKNPPQGAPCNIDARVRPASANVRGQLRRAGTHEEQGSPLMEVAAVKRHSTPNASSHRPSNTSLLNTITELNSPQHPEEDPSSEPAIEMTPYQPLMEEEDVSSQTEEEEGGAVIANLNARSPTPPSQVDASQPHPLNAGSPTPSQPDAGSPTPSQPHPLDAGSPTPSEEEVKRKGGEAHKRLLPASIFKHRSKGRGSDSPVLKQNSLSSPVEERKKRRKWFHKRSGSDSVVTNGDHPSDSSRKGVTSNISSPNLGAAEKRKLGMRKSSSDGNIHRLMLYSHTLPDTGPVPVSMPDSAGVPFRRVTTIASPGPAEPDNNPFGGGGGVAPPAATSSSHRPLRRSLTMDSPEPTLSGTSVSI